MKSFFRKSSYHSELRRLPWGWGRPCCHPTLLAAPDLAVRDPLTSVTFNAWPGSHLSLTPGRQEPPLKHVPPVLRHCQLCLGRHSGGLAQFGTETAQPVDFLVGDVGRDSVTELLALYLVRKGGCFEVSPHLFIYLFIFMFLKQSYFTYQSRFPLPLILPLHPPSGFFFL